MSRIIHLITVALAVAAMRELHIEALCTTVRQPIERLLTPLGLRSPQMRGGVWRIVDVLECPKCGAVAPLDRPDLTPWVFGSQRILCDGGCEIGVRELLDIYCDSNEETDDVLVQIPVGRPADRRYYVFELLLSKAEGDRPAKWRRVIGDGMVETLAKLEPTVDSVVRGVCVDAADLIAVQTVIRGEDEIPWCPKLPLDHRGRLTRMDWHNAPLTQVERELMRRLAV